LTSDNCIDDMSVHGTKRTCRCSRRMSVVGVTTEVGFQFCVWSSGGGWRGRGASWSIVAAGRFPENAE
jgi:hypothetical protein